MRFGELFIGKREDRLRIFIRNKLNILGGWPGIFYLRYLIQLYGQNLKECITINVYHTVMLSVAVIVQTLKWPDS